MEWYDFYFDCLQPFLSCRDWVSLSWCCKYFHKECDLKRTFYRKFKEELTSIFYNEDDTVANFIWNGLSQYNGVISGGYALSVFYWDTNFNDIDIFYESDDMTAFDLTSDTLQNKITTVHQDTTHYYYKDMDFISHVKSTKSNTSNIVWQFIHVNDKYELKNDNINLLTTQDHVKNVIFETFDLDFCKIVFTPKYVEVADIKSLVYKTSFIKFKDTSDELTIDNWDTFEGVLPKVLSRVEKYVNNGFHIPNASYVYTLDKLKQVLRIIHWTYEKDLLKYKNEQKKIKKRELMIKTLEDRQKEFGPLFIKKIFECNADIKLPTREPHIKFTNHTSLTEWIQLYNIPAEVVYFTLCYGDCSGLIELYFDKNKIPIEWLVVELPYIQRYCYLMHNVSIWKVVAARWPHHIHYRADCEYIENDWRKNMNNSINQLI